ncbi:hypothetical protein RchiOBHm_Chr5g0051851 [Rosa chinensis]|uniref:Uncharacterized protein n=1 Tax=Rosa chinensis TaxID=74649 RepID=A0A2P6QFH6_ROSCH|nr:hypothetical protein RchiOBHm_Chr5g0051851 [Rosa chinensis]
MESILIPSIMVKIGLSLCLTREAFHDSHKLFRRISHLEVVLKCDLLHYSGGLSSNHFLAPSDCFSIASMFLLNHICVVDLAAFHKVCLSPSPGCLHLKLLYKCLTQCLCSAPGIKSAMAIPRPFCLSVIKVYDMGFSIFKSHMRYSKNHFQVSVFSTSTTE